MSFPPLPWFFVQPALLWVKELRASLTPGFFRIIHSLFIVPQQLLGINACVNFMTFVPAAGWWKDP